MKWPNTLFGRTALVIAGVAVIFQLIAIGAIAYFALVPLGLRASEDFAAGLVDNARAWSGLPPQARAAHAEHVWQTHQVRLEAAGEPKTAFFKMLPYYHFLEDAVERRVGQRATLAASEDAAGRALLWLDIPTARGTVSAGFLQSRIGVYPPLALGLIFVAGTLATLLTATFLARRLTAPLRELSMAVQKVGAGQQPDSLPEGGPEEFAACVRSFNRMAGQVQELLSNRTTLLAGISHDLRTPLARMRLALAMLTDHPDPALVNQLMQDIDAMNVLISRCLEVGQGLEEPQVTVELHGVLQDLAGEARRAGHPVNYHGRGSCEAMLRPLALRRVLGNLLDNALRYSEGRAVDIELDAAGPEIRILDRGPGIPTDKRSQVFSPFYRLEPSRCSDTGGSGLGLAIVKQLVSANYWQIRLDSREGGGTVASLALSAE
jgi:two-component system osmolarity sensor histidine kinase EnvZ